MSAVGQAQSMVDQLRADGSCEDAIVDGLVRLAHIEDLLAAWVEQKRAGHRWMSPEEKAIYDEGRRIVEMRKAVWPGAGQVKEAERG